jgi:hypothetical protein
MRMRMVWSWVIAKANGVRWWEVGSKARGRD